MSIATTPPVGHEKPFELLYLEDNPADSSLLHSFLEVQPSFQSKLTVVNRLESGLRLLKERHFDAALLDLNLPDSRGVHSLELLRNQAPDLPVVVISGLLDDHLALELLSRGAQDCLDKGPALAAKIVNAVRFAIHRQETATELALRVREIEAKKAYSATLAAAVQHLEASVAEAHARSILEASIDAFMVVDSAGIVRYANPAARQMFSGQTRDLLTHHLDIPLDLENSSEVEIVRENGEPGIAEMRVVPMHWDGELANLVSLRDITFNKGREGALFRAEKLQALGTLAAGIAHDFNNILLTISGNAKLALEELPADHPVRLSVLEIAKAGSRATALTRKILSFSRQDPSQRGPITVERPIEEAISLLRATLPARIELRQSLAAGLPLISADPLQVQQIIVNLATNSADAIGENSGSIDIAACVTNLNGSGSTFSSQLLPGRYVKIAVRDSGSGMDKPTLARVFEPFFTTKPQGRGTGMGLAIVHGIMKDHRGEVSAYSEVGKGTVFNLYFPVVEEVAEPRLMPQLEPRGSGQRIIYVDDEEPLVLLISRTLKRLDYEVCGFTDPVEALKAFQRDPHGFDALVTDLSMPMMSGTELAREFLEIRKDLPVVLTSGYLRPQDREIAKNAGVLELILKPDTAEELGSTLNRLLGKNAKASRAAGQGQ